MKRMNFTQFAALHGYVDDYSILDHSMLSPSGRISGRTRGEALKRLRERLDSNRRGHEAFQAAIDKGEIIDSEGKHKPTPKRTNNQGEILQLQLQLQRMIEVWEQVGISTKTGKLRPSYKKQIENALKKINQLRESL